MNKVSVIMPAFNSARYIDEAIGSVLHQTESNLELIVVNDGSTDGTQKVVEARANKDPRIKLLNQPNSGRPAIARNRGVLAATGEFICFLDADDYYLPDKIKCSLEVLDQQPSADLVFHDVSFVDERGNSRAGTYLHSAHFAACVISASRKINELTFLCAEGPLFFFMCTRVTTILMSSVLIRRKRLTEEQYLFPEDLTIGEDIDLWFRLVRSGGVAYIDRPLSIYRTIAGSVTKRQDRSLYDPICAHIRNYQRSSSFLDTIQRGKYRHRIARDFYDIGYACNLQGKHAEARWSYIKSLRWHISFAPLKGIAKSFVS
jgi:glycosyltransferase involved in cell wall biosynthesis